MSTADKVKTYGQLLKQVPQTIKLARSGVTDEEMAEFDAKHIAPLHEKLGHKQGEGDEES